MTGDDRRTERPPRTWDTTSAACAVLRGIAGVGILAVLAGCAEPEPEPAEEPAPTAGAEEPEPQRDNGQIKGIMGTLPQRAIQGALQPRMTEFARCFAKASSEVDMIGGRVELKFRVARDGSVRWVHPIESTVGSRPVDKCIVEVASGTRFPRPHGGEAEFTWDFSLEPPQTVRPAESWSADRVSDVVDDKGDELMDECGPAPSRAKFTVTAYVAPGGEVLAAGATSSDRKAASALDCVTDKVKGWDMPDPGSYPAKVTFPLP